MKISHFLLLWSATLGLALPTSTPRKPVGNSNQNDQGLSKDELLEVARISAAYLTGIGLAGAGAWAYHRHTVKQLLEEQEEARRQSQQQLDGIIRSRERMTGRLVNAAFDRGTEAERNHRRLVRCFEEQLPKLERNFRWETREEYEGQVWNYCRELEGIDVHDPAFEWGPRKTGRPIQPPGEGSQQGGNSGSTAPQQEEEEGGPGGPQISPFTFLKNGIVNKVQTLGQNLARIAGTVAKSTNNGPSTGFVGGVKARAPAVRLPGKLTVPPWR